MKIKIPHIAVDEYTSPCSVIATEETTLFEIDQLMKDEGVRHIPVVKDERPIGLISDRDLRTIINYDIAKTLKAKDLMIPGPFTVTVGMALSEVAYEMSSKKLGSAIVLELDGTIYGIFTSTDALNALVEILRGEIPDKE